MKISKTTLITFIVLALSGLGTIFYTSIATIHNNTLENAKTNGNFSTINGKLDIFISLHQAQNTALKKQVSELSDTLYCYRAEDKAEHARIKQKLYKVITISRATNDKFNSFYDISYEK